MSFLLTRKEMEEKLGRAFPPTQADVLLEILDAIRQIEVERAADARELRQGLKALTGEVKELAAAQKRTEERMEELAAAQKRTEENLARLTQVVDRRGEDIQVLALAVERLREAVGSLSNRFGFDLEEFVAALLPLYIERHRGVSDLVLERRYFDLGGGRLEEVDLAGEGLRNGKTVTVLAECRTTVGGGEIHRIAETFQAVAPVLAGKEVLWVVVAMNVHPTAEKAAEELGLWVVPSSRINRERSKGKT